MSLGSKASRVKRILVFVLVAALVAPVSSGLAAPNDPFRTPTGDAPSAPSTSTTVPYENSSPEGPGDLTPLPPDLREKQASADAVAKELERLGDQLEMAAETYNKAKEELVLTEGKLDEVRVKLREATESYQARQQTYSERLDGIYRSGGTLDFLEVLLQTTDFTDFLTRVNYLMQINYSDSNLVRMLEADKQAVDDQTRFLEELRGKQLELQTRLEQEQERIRNMISERERILAGLEADIRRILEQDEIKKSQAQAQFIAQLKSRAANLPSSQLREMLDPSSVTATALQYLGVKYVWGGENPKIGLDCSGLVLIVFRQHGVKVRHYSGWQYGDAPMKVSKDQLRPGDLVFYGNPIHHVGIYIGDGYYIHAPRTGDVVKISSIERPDWAGAVRYPLRNKE